MPVQKLSEADIVQILTKRSRGFTTEQLAASYKVTPRYINLLVIKAGKQANTRAALSTGRISGKTWRRACSRCGTGFTSPDVRLWVCSRECLERLESEPETVPRYIYCNVNKADQARELIRQKEVFSLYNSEIPVNEDSNIDDLLG